MSELNCKLKKSGFSITFESSFVTLLLPAMIFSRYINKKKESFDPLDELRINKVLNWFFEKILKFEVLLITKGISFPVGGSRIIIAEKSK